MKIDLIVGARPNYMKAAPVFRALQRYPHCTVRLVHTGQHYDEKMSQVFFRELELPPPDIYLGVGSGTHGAQTGRIMLTYESAMLENLPDVVLVAGDVNSTMACALVAVKLHCAVGHIEAGLRSRDWSMPEEINRIVTDRIADYLFTTSRDADDNLRQEGVPEAKIFLVGNTMIDSLYYYLPRVRQLDLRHKYAVRPGEYILVTLHRPSNVDDPEVLRGLCQMLVELQKRLPVILPLHPRTRKMLTEFGLDKLMTNAPGLILTEPLGYLEFLKLETEAGLVLTDSGGVQEETTVLGIPCLTMRANTERPITIWEGTNILVGSDPQKVYAQAMAILDGQRPAGKIPPLWDGHAAERIAAIVAGRR